MSDHRQHSWLLFLNEYENTINQLHSELGAIANKEAQTGTLISSQCFNKNHRAIINVARGLSCKLLELDLEALRKFGVPVKDEVEWLKQGQNTLLFDTFWKNVLTWYAKPMWSGKTKEAENAVWRELSNIMHQAERQIVALSLEPSQPHPSTAKHQTVIHANSPGVQVNIAHDNSNINASQTVRDEQIIEAALKLVELLKAADVPRDFKEEIIDLAETAAEQAQNGKKGKGVLKALGEKMKLLNSAITGTDATIKASEDLVKHANYLWALIKPLIS